ncbi:MAG: amidohydrolase [Chloroflexi bacterium]|nr:amidohydrolase [Chloroflexota bacterium]
MNSALVRELFDEIDAMPILDIHTHVDWHTGTAKSIGDILSYHYYTELTNSAEFQDPPYPYADPKELTRVIVPKLGHIRNTVQYDWLMTISREYLCIDASEWHPGNWEAIYDHSVAVMDRPDCREELIDQCNLERVFLTNQFDEAFDGMDTSFYTPCLRTEPFVLFIDRAEERERLHKHLGRPVRTPADVGEAIRKTFDCFVAAGMGYAAMSIPTGFCTFHVSDEDAARLLDKVTAGSAWDAQDRAAWGAYAMCLLADACRDYRKAFHLMIGVDRSVYAQGVPGGTDLVDSVNSMRGYDYLLNRYPDVRFPTAVLADTTGLELTAASWIRHNVYPSGHWWYSNHPTDIAREIRRRIDAVPGSKLIGYFSDAYYLEFILPKFRMYKFELALALAERMERSLVHPNMEVFTLDDALVLAEDMLINNPTRILGLD